MRNLLLFFLLLFVSAGFGQTVLAGKITDSETGEELIGATVKVFKCGKLEKGVASNFDGDYSFQLQAGVYDLEVSYTGFKTVRLEKVIVFPKRKNVQNLRMEFPSEGVVICTFYFPKVPLIRKDETWTGQTFTSENLKNWFK
jgi:hypothetical protein